MHWSPQVSLMQGICDIYAFAFALYWCWKYDKWASFAFWRKGWGKKLFLRVMLIGYLTSYPTHIVQCALLAAIKYRAGFFPMTGLSPLLEQYKGFPVPYALWTKGQQSWIEPMEWLIAYTWAMEIICHSEELFYWIFLLRLKPTSPGWFRSWYFRATILSALALAALFFTLTGYYFYVYPSTSERDTNVFRLESVIALAFSLAIMVQNAVFSFWIIPRFPTFLRRIEEKGATPDLLRRFSTFDTLNRLRVLARWLFGIPLFILAADGIWGTWKINEQPWAVDLLLIGCYPGLTLSSILTLVIFLPIRGPYDHLAFSSSSSSPSSHVSGTSSAGPYFAQQPAPAVPAPTGQEVDNVTTFPPARRPSLPISHILRLPIHRTAAAAAVAEPPSPESPSPAEAKPPTPLPSAGAEQPGEDKSTPSEAAAAAAAAEEGRVEHPYSALVLRRRTGGATGERQAGFAQTGERILQLHPEILGFSSPIDIRAWNDDVQASSAGVGGPDEIEEDGYVHVETTGIAV